MMQSHEEQPDDPEKLARFREVLESALPELHDGDYDAPVDPGHVKEIMAAIRALEDEGLTGDLLADLQSVLDGAAGDDSSEHLSEGDVKNMLENEIASLRRRENGESEPEMPEDFPER